ncbi:MAG: hypothetical protein PHY64_02335 [Eubacteriales bacterium]|nr:hypothetical protein [Eubacteriales bacterium]
MTFDNWQASREIAARQRRSPIAWLYGLLFFVGVYFIFYREAVNPMSDLAIHAGIAKEFDFADLHSVTCRIAYPLWHLSVSGLYQLGLPLAAAAAGVTALAKTIAFSAAQNLLLPKRGEGSRAVMWLMCLLLMVVTGLRLPWINPLVYRAAGSPTVWHNPTQITVTAISLFMVPYLIHCWCVYERRLAAGDGAVVLPWKNVFWLAALLMLAASAKPTFLQALLPAAFVFFCAAWLRRPGQWRYFLRIALAFLPGAVYFLLQYLYYTGVVVEYTSGVSVYVTAETLYIAVRSVLILTAFPLLALLLRHRRGQPMDGAVALVLLMLLFSCLEAAFFHETGLRESHGNFTWATGSSALLLWWLALRSYWRDLAAFWPGRAQNRLRAAGYAASWALLGWHGYSAVYYLYYLLSSGNAF